MSSSTRLPSEIIFEILTRTSLKTLDACKAVNKEWNDLIFESSFMPQFCARSQNISGYFVQTLLFSKYITEFVSMDGCSGNSTKAPFHLPIDDTVKHRRTYDFDMKIEASTKQGILCCVRSTPSYEYYRYHICKPSTKQWLKLPNPRTRFSTVKVALIVLKSNPLYFKIIRLSSPRTNYHHYRKRGLHYYRCEVFDSESWEWRQGKDLLVPQGLYFDIFNPAVNASGLVYFKLQDDQVMALNYNGEEAFPRFSLPKPPFKYSDQLVEYKGKLGFTCLSPKGIELWVFENGNQVWELKKEVGIETLKGVTKYPKLIGFYNADIAVMKDDNRVIFYKLQDKSFNVVKLYRWQDVQEIFPFRSDLERIDLRMRGANIVSSTRQIYHPSWISLVIVFIFLFGILFSHA
ncbi:putative F-box protein At5g50220 [Lycium barbarum]|uniref:putative F-box protein At5g50220 n=1 Tax=Lycium barbarum TaxID=112863 RepID=UPI00293EECE3|nr:putative F-box protein At5g50220 [Lycium barbarum]